MDGFEDYVARYFELIVIFMNQYLTNKVGEVLAFAQVGSETLGKGKEALESVFRQEDLKVFYNAGEEHAEKIREICQEAGILEQAQDKASSTGNKLRSMRDLYLKDEWEDPAEILEWLGFFEGAAIIHWALVEEGAKESESNGLQDLAEQGLEYHRDLFTHVEKAIRSTVSS